MSPTRTRTRAYDLRGLRSRRRAEEEQEEEEAEEGKAEEGVEVAEEAEEEVEGKDEEGEEKRRRRSQRLKWLRSHKMDSDVEGEGRVRFDLDESSDNSEASEDDAEENTEEEGYGRKRRRSERLSQTKHRSFIVPDDPMDDDRDDGDYVGLEDEVESSGSGRMNRRTRKDADSDEEEKDSVSAAKLVKLGEGDASSLLTHLIINEKVDILLLDENETYTTLLAFAALRRSFEGLWCSRTDDTPFMPIKLLDLLEENYESAIRKGGHKGCGYCRVGAPKGRWYTSLKQSLSELSQVDLGRLDLNFWAHQLKDAAASFPPPISSLPTSSPTSTSSSSPISNNFPTKYIWLNPPSSPHLAGKEEVYLKKFLFDCSSIQEEGGCVFITLPGHDGDDGGQVDVDVEGLKEMAGKLGYRYIVDTSFVRDECVHNGYHTSNKEEGWRTLIFVKVRTQEEMPTMEVIGDIEGLMTALPRKRYTVVMEVDAQSLVSSPPAPAPTPTSASASAVRAQASTPEPSQPTPGSVIPSPPPSPASSAVRRSSRQHGPLLYGTYRDVPLGEGMDEQEEGMETEKRGEGKEGKEKARFWVDVPNSRGSSSRGSTTSVTRKAGNQGWGKEQTTLKGTFSSQKRTTAKPKSKQTPTHTHSLSTPVSSSPSASTSASTSTSQSKSKGKEREREREMERVEETTVTISSMVIEMGKGYRIGGSLLGGEDRGREREEERELSPEYLPPSPPAAKRQRLMDNEGEEEQEGGRAGEERMEVDSPQLDPPLQSQVNPEEEAQARDFLNFQDDQDEAMDKDPPPPSPSPPLLNPSNSRELQQLSRLRRGNSFSSTSASALGKGEGSVHSSHDTLVDPEGTTSPPVGLPSTAIDAGAAAAPTTTATATQPGLRRSQRQREKETNMDRFNRNRGQSREEAIVVDTESDSDSDGGDGEGGDHDMDSHDDHDSEDEDEQQDEEEQSPLLPLHQFVDIESRDDGLIYRNVHRYGTEYGHGQRWMDLVDVELE